MVDRSKVGLQGHSWGGYQTAFLITQADFAAAVAGAPLTNMISMYSSIYFNSGSANHAHLREQPGPLPGRILGQPGSVPAEFPGLLTPPSVNTPLIILHNDKDGAVDWNQGIEYYNTLRRLNKPVIMLQYVGENHGLAKAANQTDYTVRMKECFDHYLMGKPAPNWMTEGDPLPQAEGRPQGRREEPEAGREERSPRRRTKKSDPSGFCVGNRDVVPL